MKPQARERESLIRRNPERGFTLVELLVVIGIIGILIATLVSSYGFVQRMAWQMQAQELVSNAAAALTMYLENAGVWPQEILDSDGVMTKEVCGVLQANNLMDLTTYKLESGRIKVDASGKPVQNENSLDRVGLLDPWGRKKLRRNPSLMSVDTTDDIGMHLLRFRIDSDFDGKIDLQKVGYWLPRENQSIRAVAIVWSPGPNGKHDEGQGSTGGGKYPDENRISWSFGE